MVTSLLERPVLAPEGRDYLREALDELHTANGEIRAIPPKRLPAFMPVGPCEYYRGIHSWCFRDGVHWTYDHGDLCDKHINWLGT